ncbi:DUF4350 domain-containing protein [Nocardioides lentus]|uniref:DUF4350 domain-containing protein n=1 Tax=Nocardioides lentus TaxID=338077 RepID=A0ABP5B061_9ACTN
MSAGIGTRPGRRLLPRRSTVVVVLAVLAALGVVVLGAATADRSDPLDPDNPDSAGGQALARVLADEGVEVEVVRDADALTAAGVDDRTTVLVTSPSSLGSTTARRLLEDAAAGRVVVAGPGVAVLDLLDADTSPVLAAPGGDVPAACDARRVGVDLAGLSLAADGADAYPLPGCFVVDGAAVLAQVRPGLLLLGAEQTLSNGRVLEADNAAVALRLLGAGDRLVWYVPDPTEVSADDAVTVGSLLPAWLVPSLWLLLGASLVAILWRGRRFGPLVTEPLPVTVRATETTVSRGRLYHRARDRGHAAAALRRGTRQRTAVRLGLPVRDPDPRADPRADPLVVEVARHTGRTPDEVAWLISPTAEAPGSDEELRSLAGRLAELDREVRHP